MKKSTTEGLLNLFEEKAILHSDFLKQGDYKNGNPLYDELIGVLRELYKREELKLISRFINHSNPGVDYKAATYLLLVDENLALRHLKRIANSSAQFSMEAKYTIDEWKSGNLTFHNITT